jgi:hypothetical protein
MPEEGSGWRVVSSTDGRGKPLPYSARFEAGLVAEFVAVAPGGGALDEAFEDTEGLRG